jgi:H+-transporting ATPase
VSRLVAIGELTDVDVLCTDKTGTLTQNKLTLGDPCSIPGVRPEQVVLAAALASRADNSDTIDLAVLGGLDDDRTLPAYDVIHFKPFDPVHKHQPCTTMISVPVPEASSADHRKASSELGEPSTPTTTR